MRTHHTASFMEIRKHHSRASLAQLTRGLEDAKRQLIRDLANTHNTHTQRMFMAQDSYRTIARYEECIAEAREILAEANNIQSRVLAGTGATMYWQTVRGRQLSYIKR